MAAAGEEGVFTKLGKDLTTLRVSTIVAREIRGGQVAPEPAVMLWEIAQEFNACVAELSTKETLTGTERDILARIKTSSAAIGRVYAAIDARAQSTQVQANAAIAEYLKTPRARRRARDAWGDSGTVDRETFARLEDASDSRLAQKDPLRTAQREKAPEAPAGRARAAPVPNVVAEAEEISEGEDLPKALVASTWPIDPELLAAPTRARTRSRGLTAKDEIDDTAYQAACRTIFQLEPDEVVLVRKIWEMGTDVVLMETAIQLDGDVISRIRQHHESDTNLQALHRQLLDVALSNWQFLVQTVTRFVELVGSTVIR